MNDTLTNAQMGILRDLISGNSNAASGWEALDAKSEKNKEAVSAMQQKQYELAQTIALPFMGVKGRACIEALKRITIEEPTFGQADLDKEHMVLWMAAREGQNSIVRHILACIKRAEEGPPD